MRRLLIIGMPVASGSWCSRRSSRPPAVCLRPPSQQPEPLCPAVLTLLNAGWNLCKLFVIKLALRGETSDESTDARRERHQSTWIWAHHFHLVVGGPRASRHQCPPTNRNWQPRSTTKQQGHWSTYTFGDSERQQVPSIHDSSSESHVRPRRSRSPNGTPDGIWRQLGRDNAH